jgi:hypothetical protein
VLQWRLAGRRRSHWNWTSLPGLVEGIPDPLRAPVPVGHRETCSFVNGYYSFVAILVIGLVFVPESASYHLRRDDVLGAKEALTRLHGPQRTARIERELELAIFSYRLDAQNGAQSVGILEPLKKVGLGRALSTQHCAHSLFQSESLEAVHHSDWSPLLPAARWWQFRHILLDLFLVSGAPFSIFTYRTGVDAIESEVAGTPDSLSLDLGMMSFSVQVVGNLVR